MRIGLHSTQVHNTPRTEVCCWKVYVGRQKEFQHQIKRNDETDQRRKIVFCIKHTEEIKDQKSLSN